MKLNKAQLLKIREYYIKNMQYYETFDVSNQTTQYSVKFLDQKLYEKKDNLKEDEIFYYLGTLLANRGTFETTSMNKELKINRYSIMYLSALIDINRDNLELPDDIEYDLETHKITSNGKEYIIANDFGNKKSFKVEKYNLLENSLLGKTEEERTKALNQFITGAKLFKKEKEDYLKDHSGTSDNNYYLGQLSKAAESLKDLYILDSTPEEKNKSAFRALYYVVQLGKEKTPSGLYKIATEGLGLKDEDLEMLKSIVNGEPDKEEYKDIVENTNKIGEKVEKVIKENDINAKEELENNFYKSDDQKKKSLEFNEKIADVLAYKEAKAKYSEKVPKFEFKSLFSWLAAYFSKDASNLRKEIKAYEKSFKEKGMSPEFINNNTVDKIKENYKDKFEEVKEVLKEKKENKKELVDNIQLDQTTAKENYEKIQESENVLENEIVK